MNGAEHHFRAGPYTATQILDGQEVEPHPQQGYHVKLAVETTDAAPNGAITKHKVFWIEPCETGAAGTNVTTTTTTTTTTPTTTGTVTTATVAAVETAALGASFERTGGPSVQSVHAAPPAVLGAQLARTGAALGMLAGVGGSLTAAGYAFTRARRRDDG